MATHCDCDADHPDPPMFLDVSLFNFGMCLDVFGCPCCMGTRVEAHHWHSGINLVRFKDTPLFIVEKSHLGKFKQDQFADVFQSCRCLSKLQMSFKVADVLPSFRHLWSQILKVCRCTTSAVEKFCAMHCEIQFSFQCAL